MLLVKEVAERLAVPRSWVYSHWRELGGVRIGKYVRVSEAELERYLETRKQECQPNG